MIHTPTIQKKGGIVVDLDLFSLISNLGFPIAVAGYLLIKGSKETQNLTNAIIELKECLIDMRNHCNKDVDTNGK